MRRATLGDAGAIFESYAADHAVTRHLGWIPHKDRSETTLFLNKVTEEWTTSRGFPLVVFSHSDPADLVGMFRAHAGGFKVNDGYVLASRAWGKGCASEILGWLVERALAHPAIYRAEAFCDVDHLASARVMEKAGMIREGRLARYVVHPSISDTPRDCFMYARVL
ncbi:hypothetical protein ASG43_12310 [Aureimonas sp. Leaf454]|uniref:GNAT family N-acetyltransferase n=1 Tax=Aureimonas sp. Leaf454 TaxID=1736381 RepID=UPI0006F45888|nr:GNAT family N-acetyltransferase [Aureimonas sp. Leaf454]KQT45083.1 hypothetical protein ASG43_12310 [Aureimonas sp. Leaf454]